MHGLIHVVFKEFIVTNFGESAWAEIMSRAGVEDDSQILKMEQYEDDLTMAAVGIACEVANVPLETALELFGGHFVEFALKAGYAGSVSSLGGTLEELLSNLNLFHIQLERDLRSAIFPIFIVEATKVNHVFRLRYDSKRLGLESLVRGVLIKLAELLFDAKLVITTVQARGKTEKGEDAPQSISVVWQVEVQERHKPVKHEVCVQPAALPAAKKGSFFDFHNALISACKSFGRSSHESEAKGDVLTVQILKQKELEVRRVLGANSFGTASPEQRLEIAAVLFRGVSAGLCAAPWTDAELLTKTSNFWGAYDKLDTYYAWSDDALPPTTDPRTGRKVRRYRQNHQTIRFLSHSWGEPLNWKEWMGKNTKYGEIKSTEICGVAKDLAAEELGDAAGWAEVQFWIDKCCIPQGHSALMNLCVGLLEEFIQLSDGLVVIVTWSYFERLWCVYEWVCFLMFHDASKITLCASVLLRQSTLPHLVHTLRTFSLANCKCLVESDRKIFYSKVDSYYKSRSGFEQFLKFSAIALIAKDVACRQTAYGESAMQPWIDLATECKFLHLAEKLTLLSGVMVAMREDEATHSTRACSRGSFNASSALNADFQTAISHDIQEWFAQHVNPLLIQMREDVSVANAVTQIKVTERYVRDRFLKSRVIGATGFKSTIPSRERSGVLSNVCPEEERPTPDAASARSLFTCRVVKSWDC